jgi:hypothetical protein
VAEIYGKNGCVWKQLFFETHFIFFISPSMIVFISSVLFFNLSLDPSIPNLLWFALVMRSLISRARTLSYGAGFLKKLQLELVFRERP